MSALKIHRGIAYEGAPKVVMARVVGAAATAITTSTISTLSYIVDQYDSEDDAIADVGATSVIVETGLTPISSYIFNTLQTDNDWDADSTGYNLKVTIPATAFPTGNKWNRVEIWATPQSGDAFPGFIGVFEVMATTKD